MFSICLALSGHQSEMKLGKKLVDEGKFAEALEVLNRCALFKLLDVARDIGPYFKAISEHDVAHRLSRRSPDDFDVLLLLGRCLNGLDRLDEAAIVLVAATAKAHLLSFSSL